MGRKSNLVGQKFTRLTVIEDGGRRWGSILWRCLCDCGNETFVVTHSLRSGNTKSCGCLHLERSYTFNRKHGGRHLPEYAVWSAMKNRCYNPNDKGWKYYGGRGIIMCDSWRDGFAAFLEDMGRRPKPNLSVDRIDNNGPYSPENCRWATTDEQSQNRNWIKLTPEDVVAIRAEYQYGSSTHGSTALAEKYGVTSTTILDTANGKTWRNV